MQPGPCSSSFHTDEEQSSDAPGDTLQAWPQAPMIQRNMVVQEQKLSERKQDPQKGSHQDENPAQHAALEKSTHAHVQNRMGKHVVRCGHDTSMMVQQEASGSV